MATGLIHSACCVQGSSTLQPVSEPHSSLWLHNIPRVDRPHFLPVICWRTLWRFPHLAVVHTATVTMGVQVSLLCARFLWVNTEAQKLLSHMVILYFTVRGTARLFPRWLPHFTSHQPCTRVPTPPLQPFFLFCLFLTVTAIAGARWHLTVLLICVFLMAKDIEHLFMHLLAIDWPSVCLLWRHVYSSLLPIFNWVVHFFIQL